MGENVFSLVDASESNFLFPILDTRSGPVWCAENAVYALRRHPHLKNKIRFDEFYRKEMIVEPFGFCESKTGRYPREITDADLTELEMFFNRCHMTGASRRLTADATTKVARENSFDPLIDHINALTWDGTPRLDRWLSTYLMALDTPLNREYGKRFLISMIARGLDGGCKSDCLLVLEGKQGCGKSTAAAILGGPYFSDQVANLSSKDSSMSLRGYWVIELAEMAATFTKPEVLKGFISRQVESFRPPYGTRPVSEPRRCVFIGTTNKSDWLTDETGGRRFWPVAVGEVDLEALRHDRDQLLGEAKDAYLKGETWELPESFWQESSETTSDRYDEHPWTNGVADALIGKTTVTTSYLLGQVGVSIGEQNAAKSRDISKIMTRLGWVTCRVRISGKQSRAWKEG